MKYSHIKSITPIVLALLFCACANSASSGNKAATTAPTSLANDKEVQWLIGTWQAHAHDGITYEVWKVQNDSTYAASSFFVKGSDTTLLENVQLIRSGKDMYYIPTVPNQNNGEAVSFKRIPSADGSLLFENPAHDFPQKISYKMVTTDSLIAFISGTVSGKPKRVDFPMTRVK